MSGLYAPGVGNPYRRLVNIDGAPKEIKMREPSSVDLGHEALNSYRDELVGNVMNVAAALVPMDNSKFDEHEEAGAVEVKDLVLFDDQAVLGLAAGGGRDVELGYVKFGSPTKEQFNFEEADPNALFVKNALIKFKDGSEQYFKQFDGAYHFQDTMPGGQVSRMTIESNGKVEWTINDPAHADDHTWAQ